MKNKKYKGVQYIAQRIRKHFPKKYPTHKSALVHARLAYADIQEGSGKVILKDIYKSLSTPRKPKRPIPILEGRMGELKVDYFEFAEYVGWILACQDNLLITSKIIPSSISQPLIGGKEYDENVFTPYITYVNDLIETLLLEGEENHSGKYFIMTTTPVPDKKRKGFYTCKIIACDSRGKEEDLGFDPKEPDKLFSESGKKIEPKKIEATATETQPTAPTSATEDKDVLIAKYKAAAEESKSRRIIKALDALEKGLITNEQFNAIIK